MTDRGPVKDRRVARDGHVHDALFFGSGEDLLGATLGFALEAVASGERLALACTRTHNDLVAEAVGDRPGVTVVDRETVYVRAPAAIDRYRQFASDALEAGATGVRILGEVPFGSDAGRDREWGRFEAIVNHALASLPVWSLCAYDVRTTPAPLLDVARATHPHLWRGTHREANPEYVRPAGYLALHADPPVLAVEATRAELTLTDVASLREAREEVRRTLDRELRGRRSGVDDFLLAVHEVTANAARHGRPPVTLRLWVDGDRTVCTVTDSGPGFDDPFAGYLRDETSLGLWATRQLCDELDVRRDEDGFTVRLRSTFAA